MNYSFKWYFLRWLRGVVYTADGLTIFFSLGFLDMSNLSLTIDNKFITESERLAFDFLRKN